MYIVRGQNHVVPHLLCLCRRHNIVEVYTTMGVTTGRRGASRRTWVTQIPSLPIRCSDVRPRRGRHLGRPRLSLILVTQQGPRPISVHNGLFSSRGVFTCVAIIFH